MCYEFERVSEVKIMEKLTEALAKFAPVIVEENEGEEEGGADSDQIRGRFPLHYLLLLRFMLQINN